MRASGDIYTRSISAGRVLLMTGQRISLSSKDGRPAISYLLWLFFLSHLKLFRFCAESLYYRYLSVCIIFYDGAKPFDIFSLHPAPVFILFASAASSDCIYIRTNCLDTGPRSSALGSIPRDPARPSTALSQIAKSSDSWQDDETHSLSHQSVASTWEPLHD